MLRLKPICDVTRQPGGAGLPEQLLQNHVACIRYHAATQIEGAMDNLAHRGQPDRSKINMHEAHEVKYWTRQLHIDRAKLQALIDKVGNSAAAVRKELAV